MRERIRDVLSRGVPGAGTEPEVEVAGWVRSRRDSKGGFSFIDLADGSCLDGIQVVAPGELPNYADEVLACGIGTSVRVRGTLVASRGKGQAVEIQAATVERIGACDPEAYPIQKQATSLEHLRTLPHLRPRTRTFQAIMRVRSHLAHAVHRFFSERGFLYLHTPIITANDCEGAGELFRIASGPHGGEGRAAADARAFFGRPAYLTVSGQLEGEEYASALGEVYAFGPTFRAEDSNTPRHLAEFWMIEPEMAFCDLDGDRELACAFVREVVRTALEGCPAELAFLEKRQAEGLRAALTELVEAEFAHLTYAEALAALEQGGKRFEFPVRPGMDLQTEHERFLTEQYCRRPVVVTNYPRTIKPFYMRVDGGGETVAAMDVLVPRMGELIGGSQREERLDVLTDRMRECGLDPAAYERYLDLRRFGSVPHAGFGLGFERLVCLVTGTANIRDAIPYPRTPGHVA